MDGEARRWGAHRAMAAMAVVAAGVLGAACSSGSSAPRVASLPGQSATSAPSNESNAELSAQSDQDMVDFARCMRQHGVQMADPSHVPGHTGLSIELPPQTSATHAAYAACNHFIAKDIAAKEGGAGGPTVAHLPALTRYAACMRVHDISMLDPTPQGQLNLGDVPGLTSDFGRYSPQFRSADGACRHLLPAGTRDDGTGP
jgi:hypothetical protein